MSDDKSENDNTKVDFAPGSTIPRASSTSSSSTSGHAMPNGQHQNSSNEDMKEQRQYSEKPTTETRTIPQDSDAFVGWDDNDCENPRTFRRARKWLIVSVIALSSFCVTMNSTIVSSTWSQTDSYFNVSREVSILSVTTFVCGLGLGPMLLAPLSEFYGRRVIYICAFSGITIWSIPCAATCGNIQTLLIARFFDGLCGSAFLSVAGGTIGDMFEPRYLSWPMLVYSGSPFIGPALGPVVGGFMCYNLDWRWVYRLVTILSGLQTGLIFLFIPETYEPVLLRRKAQRLRKETGDNTWIAPIEKMDKTILRTIATSCVRPFELLLFEPMVLNLCILSSLQLGILYSFFASIPLIFETNHGFNLWQSGLTFLGLFVGMVAAMLSDPIWRNWWLRLVEERETKTGEMGVSEPEFRLPPTVVGVQVMWISLLGFGWTTYSSVHYIVPIIFTSFTGFGIIISFSGVFTYLVQSYPLYAASALAANSFLRSSFAAGFPLFADQMFERLGFQWATSLLAFLTMILAPFPYLFFKYGVRIRRKSRYAKS